MRWLASDPARFLIEDDFDSEFRFSGLPIPPLQSIDRAGCVVYLNTFSQTIAPSIRMGYLVLPPSLVAPFREKLGFYSCSVPTFEQLVLAELIESGDFERHINRVRRAKRRALAAGED